MQSSTSYHEHLEQAARLDREREAEEVFRARYEGEQRDRATIRRELERGVPPEQIEEQLALASDFVRLNPGQDVHAYIRRLMEKEKRAFHALSEAGEPLRDGLPPAAGFDREQRPEQTGSASLSSSEQPLQDIAGPAKKPASARAPNPKTVQAEAMARDYVNENFKPDEWLAVVAINRRSGETVQRVSPARSNVSPEYQRWLRYLNATGSDVYISLNTFKERARGRTKEDLKDVRHLYLDLDEDGARKLEAIRHDRAVPAPNYVLNTSPGKFQVIWRVEAIGQDEAEAMLRTLAQRFGGDPAATDSSRVFRLPGFNNKKYAEDFEVRVTREAPATQVYRADDFRIYGQDPQRAQAVSARPYQERPPGADTSQSERDWAYALRKLKAGEDPQQIIRDMGAYRSKDRYDKNNPTKVIAPAKARPYYYAEHTVTQAMAHLGMTKRPEAPQKSGTSREAESQPSR